MSTPNEQLYLAAARGKLDDLKAALAAGADPNAPSEDGPTPLVMAARSGYVDGIRALVAAGADPGAPAGLYGSPLRHAVAEGHLEAVRALVEAGAPLVSRSAMEGPVLVWADDPEIIRYLVSTGAEVDARRAGQTALIMAAINKKHRVAAVLLELGADRNATDGDRTAMEWAVANDDAEMVALLSGSASAAEVAPREPEGVPSFRYAAPSGQWLEVEGVQLSEEFDYPGFVQSLLAGRQALGLQDHYPYDRLERVWNRLTAVLDSLSRAVAECLTDPSALVRSQALMFFRERAASAGAERVEELAESQRQTFAGVTDPIHRDVDLEPGLLGALGARARAGSWRAADLAKRIVLEPGKAEPLLNVVPQEYLLEHADEIARGTPGSGAYLIGLLAGKGRDWRPLVALAAGHPEFEKRLEWYVSDESLRAQVRAFAEGPGTQAEGVPAPATPEEPPQEPRPLRELPTSLTSEAAGPVFAVRAESPEELKSLPELSGSLTAQVAAVLQEPASAARTGKLYELGVALFQAIQSGGEPPASYDLMARALIAAAEAGHVQAWVELGRCRWNGWGVPQNIEAALEAYKKAAALGSHYGAYVAAHNLYWIFRRDDEAYRYAQQALAGEDPEGEAYYLLGLMAYNGRGREKDDAESFRMHKEAARRGNADALFELHIFYAKGVCCEPDAERAAECLRRAAAKGQARACYNLGAFHATGAPCFEKDIAKSVHWYSRAAELGQGGAAATLGVMYLQGQDVPHDVHQARKWLDRARALRFDPDVFLSALGLTAPEAVPEQQPADRQSAKPSGDQAVGVDDDNLKLALIQALRNKGLLPPFDKEAFHRQELEEDYDDCADYNYEVDDRVRDYLLETPITRELAMAVDTLYWSGGQEVQHDVWTYWDGEDDEFDICDLAGIERFPNLREISVGCQAVQDWSPLGQLPRLEVLVIDGGRMDDIGQLLRAPALKRVKLSYVKGKDTPHNQQATAALRERSVDVEWK